MRINTICTPKRDYGVTCINNADSIVFGIAQMNSNTPDAVYEYLNFYQEVKNNKTFTDIGYWCRILSFRDRRVEQ